MADSLLNWLALREPADTDARSQRLTNEVVAAIGRHDPLGILDLGTGTASNVRYLAGRLFPLPQRWLIVDRDPVLLAEARAQMSSWGATRGYDVTTRGDELVIRGKGMDCRIETLCQDLGRLEDPGIFAGRHLVTASALLDLVSAMWLEYLAARCRAVGAVVLFALTYDGRSHCSPEEPEDDEIRELLNRHQRGSDKGFGPAAGPDAVEHVSRAFAADGYRVRREATNWLLPWDKREFQTELIEGWARAALEIAPDQAGKIASWLARRLGHVEAGRSLLTVCHEDIAAWLPSAASHESRA
jgi:hypothetical protein